MSYPSVRQLYIGDDRAHVFLSLYLAKFIGVGEYFVSMKTVSEKYVSKYGIGFNQHTGHKLKEFFDPKDLAASSFLQIKESSDGTMTIRAKIFKEIPLKLRALTLKPLVEETPRKRGKSLGRSKARPPPQKRKKAAAAKINVTVKSEPIPKLEPQRLKLNWTLLHSHWNTLLRVLKIVTDLLLPLLPHKVKLVS